MFTDEGLKLQKKKKKKKKKKNYLWTILGQIRIQIMLLSLTF